MNIKGLRLVTAAALAVGGFGMLGCDRDDDTTARVQTTSPSGEPGPSATVTVDGDKADSAAQKTENALENAGENIKEGLKDTGEAIQAGAQKTGDALKTGAQRAGNAIDRGLNKAGDTVRGDGTAAPDGTAAAPDAEGIRDVFAQVAEAALTKGGLDDLVERFVDADRNRIGNTVEQKFDDLDGKVDELRKALQAKYNQEFDINDEEAAFPANFLSVVQGEIPEGAAGAEVKVDVDRTADGAAAKVDVDNKSGVDSPDTAAADANRNDPGRNVARVQVAASHGLPHLTVPLVHEFPDQWKIDVPDNLTGPVLKDNLLKHLNMIDVNALPADVNEAYRMVTHHVLMAVLGMDK